jgi:hypothetical protein
MGGMKGTKNATRKTHASIFAGPAAAITIPEDPKSPSSTAAAQATSDHRCMVFRMVYA